MGIPKIVVTQDGKSRIDLGTALGPLGNRDLLLLRTLLARFPLRKIDYRKYFGVLGSSLGGLGKVWG